MQDEMIAFYGHTLTVVYKDTYTGSGVFDFYSSESLNPNTPLDTSNATVNTTSSLVITGMGIVSVGLGAMEGAVAHLPIGSFEPGNAVFTCKISDVTVGTSNIFNKCDYCVLSLDGQKYIPVKMVPEGLKDLYVYHIVLAKTNR